MKTRRHPSSLPSLAIVATAVFVGFLCAIPFLMRKDSMGFAILVVVPALSVVATRLLRSAGATEDSDVTCRNAGHGALVIAALFAGPIIGGLIVLPSVFSGNLHPDDVKGTVMGVVFLGLLGGSVVALAVWLPGSNKTLR